MVMRLRIFGAIFLMSAPLPAQTAMSPLRVVSGIVFDSVANKPLAGAVVQVALADSTLRVFSGIADTGGRYRIVGLPAGRFAIGFQHGALYALGLESPLRAFQLADDTSITVNLAIPSGPKVNAQLCGNVARDARDGMLTGYVTDARSEGMLSGAVVVVQWYEVAFDKGEFHTEPHRSIAPVDAEGHFVACALATEAPIGVQVTMPGYRGIDAQISIPVGGVARRDFRLADSAASRGTSTLTGRVQHADGSPIATGRAIIAELSLEVRVVNGMFTIADLPAGTWEVEALAIGYEPHTVLIDAADYTNVNATITISKRARMLDAVTVYGRPTGDLKIVEDIMRRSRTTFGSVFLPGNSALKGALYPMDVLRTARGFSYVSMDSVVARGCGLGSGGKGLVLYLDGLRFRAGMDELRNAVPMRDLLAVEAYPDVGSMPLQWRQDDTCAVIAVWTKR
jgi:hypothetical protein